MPTQSASQEIIIYFTDLCRRMYSYLDVLPISREPEALEAIMARLKPALDQVSAPALIKLGELDRPAHAYDRTGGAGVGLNTIGMLADRLTILTIREWSIRHKGARNDEKARSLYQDQTLDIIAAIAATRPGTASLNSKITHIIAGADARDWVEAIWGLFATNLLLWESQEILYIKDIGALPAEELRSYIKWFAEGNIRRNEFIQLCEKNYWK